MALPLATRLVARLREVPGVTHASYCGSLRRFAETVSDGHVVGGQVRQLREAALEPVAERLARLDRNQGGPEESLYVAEFSHLRSVPVRAA